jgi:beta-glucosidase
VLDGDPNASVTLRQALAKRLTGNHCSFVPGLSDCRSEDESGFDQALAAVRAAEVAVVVLGEDAKLSGEAKCRAFLGLPGRQLALLERLAEAGTPLVVVFLAGRPLVIERALELATAALFAWHPGTMVGPALSDLLFGEANPSGKLPMSLPRAEGQIPVYYAHRNTGRPPLSNRRGVPTGTPLDPIDFDSSYVDLDVSPLFCFGFGLSYTRFTYSELSVTPKRARVGTSVRVSVVVTNQGATSGTETAQLYVRDPVASVTRPVRELKGFQRVSLAAGERRTLVFELDSAALAFAGRDMKPTVEAGSFQVYVGGDSDATLSDDFELT